MAVERILKSGYVRMKRRLDDLSPSEARRAREDVAAVVQRLPELADFEALSEASAERLGASHGAYVGTVSKANHAASMELCVLLDVLLRQRAPRRVVDLGSGYTSFVVRTWAAEEAAAGREAPEVWSVDDHAGWLEKTRAWLGEQGLSDEHLLTWEEFRASNPGDFDLVLHDMGSMETRARTLDAVLDLAAPGGLVILDDVHKPDFRRFAIERLEARGQGFFSLKAWTRDDLTRYAYLVM